MFSFVTGLKLKKNLRIVLNIREVDTHTKAVVQPEAAAASAENRSESEYEYESCPKLLKKQTS